ncbi:zinc ABC transporter substrate-binding protein [Thermoleptolyngbya sp. M55_K2018_002]|uniref:metal ABC transporter solute-binding protein, Zn/Mn family n=1 Tax=Thermoleptolyngbya sp. M55_K2018_002 TaxID=2747808 RepID=UPI0019ECAFA1|nr:zinc ABC transporter substrate-binding protein [Thermoleptolyngbya sp. M55_K2018_002]HIK39736.1 zinc ABC transporter substrate-binding protein [Thermoleptolyngbya sp. M55_K2018_002]
MQNPGTQIFSWTLGRRAAVTVLGAIALGWLANSCRTPPVQTGNSEKPVVVATNTILADLTQQVGGEAIALVSILKPGDDPHVYEPVPSDTQRLEDADLILYNGYNLEPGLIRLAESVGVRGRRVAVGEVVPPLELAEKGSTVPDPHVWGDAQNAIQMVNAIRDELIRLSPEDAATFTQNAADLVATLERLDGWITQQIQTIPPSQRQLVTTHDAFQYYARAYGLTVLGTLIGISTEEQPSAQTLQRLADAVKAANVPAIFAETAINPRLINTVAEEAGVPLADTELHADSIGGRGSGAESYVDMMVANTRAIARNLGGTPSNWPQ